MSELRHVAVIGAGAFGTALALVARKAEREVTLWGRNAGAIDAIRQQGENIAHLPNVSIPPEIEVTADATKVSQADIVLFAVPAQATRAAVMLLGSRIRPGTPVVACAKGIEQGTGRRQSEVVADILPEARPAALSGPGFAEEIARGLPTAVTIAADTLDLAHRLAGALASDSFRPYASDDLVGVELGGAIKNVLAIAAGVIAGRALGEGARAALVARGLAEMTRLGAALGARAETFMGLSGLGDLVLTATSRRSRNLQFGMALGAGRPAAELLAAGVPLVEGAYTARVAAELAARLAIDAPILAAVAAIIDGTLTIEAAIEGLVNRPLKAENA